MTPDYGVSRGSGWRRLGGSGGPSHVQPVNPRTPGREKFDYFDLRVDRHDAVLLLTSAITQIMMERLTCVVDTAPNGRLQNARYRVYGGMRCI